MGVFITLVVAAANNNAIGKENRLLWCLPNDMKYFKNVTRGECRCSAEEKHLRRWKSFTG